MWWMVSTTSRFSVKRWDAKFETVLRHSLNDSGFKDQDILSSVNRLHKDENGEWAVRHLELRAPTEEKIKSIINSLESSGAVVIENTDGKNVELLVKRGARIYQEIKFIQPEPPVKPQVKLPKKSK